MKITTTSRKLKVTAVIDSAPLAALKAIPDNAPPRCELVVKVDGQNFTADISSKTLRKAVRTLTESGIANCTCIIQGTLAGNDRIEEAGLVCNVKEPVK
jgi:hypothetical protein